MPGPFAMTVCSNTAGARPSCYSSRTRRPPSRRSNLVHRSRSPAGQRHFSFPSSSLTKSCTLSLCPTPRCFLKRTHIVRWKSRTLIFRAPFRALRAPLPTEVVFSDSLASVHIGGGGPVPKDFYRAQRSRNSGIGPRCLHHPIK